jgi:hypothetical protein
MRSNFETNRGVHSNHCYELAKLQLGIRDGRSKQEIAKHEKASQVLSPAYVP